MNGELLNDRSKFELRWLVDREHVGTLDSVIAADIAERLAGQDSDLAAQAVAYAVQRHNANRGEYETIMGMSAGSLLGA